MSLVGSGPFGTPDGSRAAIEDVLDGFVSFGGNEFIWGGLAMRSEDRTARVIVGRKGSGKTVYLRRLQADAAKEESLYADSIQQEVPTTDTIVKFCQMFPNNVLTGNWTQLWRRAILRSVVSHLLNEPRLSRNIPVAVAESLRKDYKPILFNYKTPVSVYSQVTQIIEAHHTANHIRTFFNHPLWDQLEWTIAECIKDCPPVCFFIDAVDDGFEEAPMYWLRCQLGLFYATMHSLRDSRLGGRLHVFICIRDIVYSSVLQSEHRSRYKDEPHIRILDWNKNAISYLLLRKVERLTGNFFVGSTEGGKTIAAWLGQSVFKNSARGVEEPIEQYLLRHTRLLPRDVIILGNHICKEMQKAYRFSPETPTEAVIRRAVADTARFVGDEQLKICANQITSNSMPNDAARRGYSDIYTGNKAHIRGIADDLKTLIGSIGKDRFTWQDYQSAKGLVLELFGEEADPFSVLWQHGLLGYAERRDGEKHCIFYSEDKMDDFNLPLLKQEYVFHSCLIDSVGIESVGNEPVV
jgi:hypothetical protein